MIETVAAQPWVALGKPGMVGISYPGISQLFVAQTQPPHLAAIAPLSVIADTFRSTLYPGGIFNDGFALSWAQDRVNNGKPYGQGWEHGIVDAGGANGAQCAENQLLRHQNQDLIGDIAANPFYPLVRRRARARDVRRQDQRADVHGRRVAGRADRRPLLGDVEELHRFRSRS